MSGVGAATAFMAAAFGPLESWITDEHIKRYVRTLGFALPSVPTGFDAVHDAAVALLDGLGALNDADLDGTPAEFAVELAKVVVLLGNTIGAIEALPASLRAELPVDTYVDPSGIADAENGVHRRLLDALLFQAITRTSQTVRGALVALGIMVEEEKDPDGQFHPAFTLRQINRDRLGLLFGGKPFDLLKDVYGWGTPHIDAQRLHRTLTELSFGLLGMPDILRPTSSFIAAMFPGVPIPPEGLGDMFGITLGIHRDLGSLSIGLLPAPKATLDEPQALALRVLGSPTFKFDVPITPTLTLSADADFTLDTGLGVLIRPNAAPVIVTNVESAFAPATKGHASITLERVEAANPIVLFDFGGGSDLRCKTFFAKASIETPPEDVSMSAGVQGGKLIVSLDSADGFMKDVVPSKSFELDFDLGIGWSNQGGIFVTGSAGLETVLVLNKSFGPVTLKDLHLALLANGSGLHVKAGLGVAVTLGPVTGVVEGIGVESLLAFKSGNLGPLDLSANFLFPTGIGIAIDAAAVKGGGFLSLDKDAGRYGGVLELQIFAIAIKAFGLLETKFADGSEGYSFVIVVVAEFTPIQLGFGFTLLGVGGMLGINRTVNTDALSDAIRTGSLEHLLFPHDVIHNAPAIIHDLATVFPPARGHFLFGPMAKLGWGTPTLITAELGIIIEFPGPRIALLGLLHMLLPDPDKAVVRLQMAVAGIFDFPAKKFSLDASLFDSTIADYAITGDMAYRQELGDKGKFLLAIGGFNPGFSPPAPFPELRRASINLGVNGNPSLTAFGYLAVTSNTAQIGSSIELKASGYGITVNGWVGFDATFVFSPFSFTGSVSGGMRASFHGAGFGITLHGKLTGPNPWHLTGRVCVSVLWWDACLPIDVTFGNAIPVALPEIDPWLGDSTIPVTGLKEAISDARNWAGTSLPSDLNVVTLAPASTASRTPIDPLGAATLRQKVVPFNQKLEKFGEYKPKDRERFSLGPGVGSVKVNDVAVTQVVVVEDDFVPGHFLNLTNEQKLSFPSYEKMDAGIAVAPDRTRLGSSQSRTVAYVTKFIDDDGNTHGDADHTPDQTELDALMKRSPAGLGGARKAGDQRYMLGSRPRKIQLDPRAFLVADACTLVRNSAITGTETSQIQALLALRDHERLHPEERDRFAVIPAYAERHP